MNNLPIIKLPLVILGLLALIASGRSPDSPADLSRSQMLNCELRLRDLGYWIETIDGKPDDSTLAAIKAFRRINDYENLGQPNGTDLPALDKTRPLTAKIDEGAHFEVDIRRQIIFFVDMNCRISHILPVSTGSGQVFTEGEKKRLAETPRGRFTVYRKMYGWREGPLGQMYYPNYIVGGVSVHGSSYVADYPRTHGCIAVPMFAAEKLSELMPVGTVVIVRKQSKSL
jgi:N-acetylmuramoyl-L-alanine amidase